MRRESMGRMTRHERASRIIAVLDGLYPETPIPLNHNDPYTLLVAVMLSAQTTDKKVNEVTPHLFTIADTPEKMAALPVERIREIIREIGLAPTKAKNLGSTTSSAYWPSCEMRKPFPSCPALTPLSLPTFRQEQDFPAVQPWKRLHRLPWRHFLV